MSKRDLDFYRFHRTAPLSCCRADRGPHVVLVHRETNFVRAAHVACILEWQWRPQMGKWAVPQYDCDLSTFYLHHGGDRWQISEKR